MVEIDIMIFMIRSLKTVVTQNTGLVLLTIPTNPDNIIPSSHTFQFIYQFINFFKLRTEVKKFVLMSRMLCMVGSDIREAIIE